MQTLKHDLEFLHSHGTIDYSLLLVIELLPFKRTESDKIFDDMLKHAEEQRRHDDAVSLFSRYDYSQSRTSSFHTLRSCAPSIQKFKFLAPSCRIKSVCGRYIYHLCVIDFLSTYTCRKRIERLGKSIIVKLKSSIFTANDLSVAPPTLYRDRFQDFMSQVVF